jgi:predicted nucleic acid-binding protein
VITPNGSDRFVVDSSGWVEYMGGGTKADSFASYLESVEKVLLPSIIVYEVHRKLFREQGKHLADVFLLQALGFGERLIQLSLELSILASRTSLQTGLPMADAIIYTTAGQYQAQLITSDSHFANLDGVTLL